MTHLQKFLLVAGLLSVWSLASPPELLARTVEGKATVYHGKYHGRKTASGERYNQNAMTVASPYLPFGMRLNVRNKNNGRTAVVRVNDRMARGGAVLDLSRAAARKLGVKSVAAIRAVSM